MALNEQLVSIQSRHHVFLQRLISGEVDRFLPILKQLQNGVLKRLTGDLTEFSRSRLEVQLAELMRFQKEIYKDYINGLNSSLLEIGLSESEFEQSALNKILSNYQVAAPSNAQIIAAIRTSPLSVVRNSSKLLKPFIDDWSKTQMNIVNGAIRDGWVQGQTINQMAANLKKLTGEELLRTNQAIVRTAINHVSQSARRMVWSANADIITGWRFLAVLDGRTSDICSGIMSLDRVYPVDKGPYPPRHINCRSTSIPELDDRFKADKDNATQASMGGQVDADLTYFDWLKTQPKEFVTDVLGVGKGEALLSGKLSAKDFAKFSLNRRFEPLTLAEMIKKDKKLNLGLFG